MFIKSIFLQDFRNYETQTLELNSGLNIFVGDNAQGKTNLLEAIYVLSLSKSYRTGRETELIRHGAEQTAIGASVQKMALLDLRVIVSNSTTKKLLVNEKSTTANAFVGKLNTVLFTPDSLQLVKGSPGNRRHFLDVQICQIDPIYRNTLLKYQRVVRQRNSLLKEAYTQRALLNQLPAWDNQLVTHGKEIILRRQEAIKVLDKYGRQTHRTISDESETLDLVYQPFFAKETKKTEYSGSQIEEVFWEELKSKNQDEIRRGYTLVGPHRDEVLFLINNSNLKTYGSQGQQRTAVLAYILAELELMYEEIGEYPVVLLDDVMSELDQTRRSFLLSILNKKAQTIVTTTNLASFGQEIVQKATVFQIDRGKIL